MPTNELLNLEHQWAASFKNRDIDFLQEFLAPEFRLSFADDPRAPKVFSRESWFENLKHMGFGECEIVEHTESIHENVGVFHMFARFKDWTFDGQVLPSDFYVTDVFVRRTGRWQVVNRISEGVQGSPSF
jgi:hypothetical protein